MLEFMLICSGSIAKHHTVKSFGRMATMRTMQLIPHSLTYTLLLRLIKAQIKRSFSFKIRLACAAKNDLVKKAKDDLH